MTNTFFTAEDAAQIAGRIARPDFGASALVYRDVEADYRRGSGSTVNVRIPGAGKASSKSPDDVTTPLDTSALTEQTIPVTLTDHAYHRAVLSEEDLSLNIRDYTEQVLRPQGLAVATFAENAVVTAMKSTPLSTAITWTPDTVPTAFSSARATLRQNGVGENETIHALAGTNVYAALLDADLLNEDDKVRKVHVHENSRIAPDEVIVFVRQAFALAVRAPSAPEGVPFSASIRTPDDEGAFAVRYVRSYDSTIAGEVSLLSTFVGARAMPLPVYDDATGVITLKENAGAVRFGAATTA